MNKVYFFLLVTLMFNSCLSLEFNDDEQVYPNIDFNKINNIEFSNYKMETKIQITDSAHIAEFATFFKDSSKYFTSELIKTEGQKSLYSLKFMSKKDTLAMNIYPTEEKNKLIIGFFEPKNPDDDKWDFRKYNRFYVNKQILELVEIEIN